MGKGFFLKVVCGNRRLRGADFIFNNEETERNDPSDCMHVAVTASHAAGDAKSKRGRIIFEPSPVAITWPLVGLYWWPDSGERSGF